MLEKKPHINITTTTKQYLGLSGVTQIYRVTTVCIILLW